MEEGAAGVEGRHHHPSGELGPVGEGDAGGAPVVGDHPLHRGFQADLRPEGLGGPGEDLGEAAVAPLVERPSAELPVVLADDVVEQHQPRALGAGPHLGADDPGAGEQALQELVLEVVVQEVGGAAGEEADDVVEHSLG